MPTIRQLKNERLHEQLFDSMHSLQSWARGEQALPVSMRCYKCDKFVTQTVKVNESFECPHCHVLLRKYVLTSS